MEDRIEELARLIDEHVERQGGQRLWYVQEHIDEVADYAAMIAAKRGLDVEVARMIGMLHDIHTLTHGYMKGHAIPGSEIARELLTDSGLVSADELETICTAITFHSKKRAIHDAYSELIKDADTLSHYHEGAGSVVDKERQRLRNLKTEFNL